ncbi:MAG: hypothetical protein ACRENS_05040 [Candidatus Eiseniibacteriota bacterium]
MRLMLAVLLLLVGACVSSCSTAGTGFSARVEIGSAPPPPPIHYRSDLQWRYLSDCDVFVLADEAHDYDMFRLGGTFYVYNAGYWYRSRSYRGRFVAIEERRVPKNIFRVDEREYRWRHRPMAWGNSDHSRGQDHDHDRDHDR